MDRYAQVVNELEGQSVVALATCWTADGEIDFEAMKKYVNWLCERRVPAITTTYGFSQMWWMSDDDVWRLTAELAEAIAGRCIFISSTLYWPPKVARRFLKHAEQVGADAVKVQINHWPIVSSSPPQKAKLLRDYLHAVKDAADIPLLLWANFFGSGAVNVETIAELAGDRQIVGMKNDEDPFYYYYDLLRATADEDFVVMSGGQMRNWVYGCGVGKPAYLSGMGAFRPDLDRALHELLAADDLRAAWEYTKKWEEPLFKLMAGRNPQRTIHSLLHLHGLYPSNLPGPLEQPDTPEQCEELRLGMERALGPIEHAGL